MVNIFDTLPRNFFNIFNTADRVVISECICVLYEYIKDDASFASLKENLIYELTKYFSSHLIELEELQSQSPRERAFYVYRRLKECGWLSEEVGENYHVYASFEDYAISIIETLMNLEEDRDIEYSSMVYSIYSQFKNFDIENGHKTCTLYILIKLCQILDTTPNEILSDCVSLNHDEKETFIVEMQRSLKADEKEFLVAFQMILNKYLEDKR